MSWENLVSQSSVAWAVICTHACVTTTTMFDFRWSDTFSGFKHATCFLKRLSLPTNRFSVDRIRSKIKLGTLPGPKRIFKYFWIAYTFLASWSRPSVSHMPGVSTMATGRSFTAKCGIFRNETNSITAKFSNLWSPCEPLTHISHLINQRFQKLPKEVSFSSIGPSSHQPSVFRWGCCSHQNVDEQRLGSRGYPKNK